MPGDALPPDPIAQIADHLGAIRAVLEAGHAAAEVARAAAKASLDAAQATRDAAAAKKAATAPPLDPFPFTAVPAGTTVRELPQGGRIFTLADGAFVRIGAAGEIVVVTQAGEVVVPATARGGRLALPDGRELTIRPEALKVRHDVAGISGLPDSVDPILVREGRFSATFPDGTRVEVAQPERLVTVVTRIGSFVFLGASRLEAVGDSLDIRPVLGGYRSFVASESRVAGVVESDGSVHVTLPGGEDLVVRFPTAPSPSLPTLPSTPEPFCRGSRA